MDQLTITRSFVHVTKCYSFSGAARELGISASLVSRHIAELERMLGVHLVNRTTRTISLTGAGVRYAEFATRIIDEIDREQAALRGMHDNPEGPVAVIGPKWIGVQEVVDAIIAFSGRYPKIRLRFEVGGASEGSYDLLDRGFDVAFHTRRVREQNLMLRKIADLDFVLCASPGYLKRARPLDEVSELAEHDCVVNTNYDVWHLRHAGHDLHLRISDPVYASNTYLTLRKAALADRGIALLPMRQVALDLAKGSLVRVLPDSEVQDRQLYAVHRPADQSPARVRLFVDFITNWFSAEQAPPALHVARADSA